MNRQMINQVVESTTGKLNSLDVAGLIALLNAKSDPEGFFCDRFELGSWFYEALQLNNVHIVSLLESLASERMDEEESDAEEAADRRRHLEREVIIW